MLSPLLALYDCEIELCPENFLLFEERSEYRCALRSEEKAQAALEAALPEEARPLLERFLSKSAMAQKFETIGHFRRGLSLGLRLAVFVGREG